MSALTAHEAGLMRMYKAEEEATAKEVAIMEDMEVEMDELIMRLVTEFEERGLYIDNKEASQRVVEYLTAEYIKEER